MTNYYFICFLFMFVVPFATSTDTDDALRDQKLISTFQVVRFPNDACTGTNSRNGTCYTSAECSDKGGSSSGSCADGFGVCCTFLINVCGSSSSENLTSWTSPTTVDSGVCLLKVIPVSDDICSLRLDFTTLVITGPSTHSYAQTRRRLGTPVEQHETEIFANFGASYITNCFTDQFYTQGPSPSTNPPVVCGILTGSHMYLEADVDRGNMLQFVFSDAATVEETITRGVATAATRSWDITITHVECSSATLPPIGCTKYYWAASGAATITNYNYDTTTAAANVHLAQQHERICIRRERGKCVGCFSATAAISFEISNPTESDAVHSVYAGGCCGYYDTFFASAPQTTTNIENLGTYNAAGGQLGWDCVIIPGAFASTTDAEGSVVTGNAATTVQLTMVTATEANMNVPQGPQICGNGGGIGAGTAKLDEVMTDIAAPVMADVGSANSSSVCTRNVPFILEFMSDDVEGLGGTADDQEFGDATQTMNQGFHIGIQQLDC